MNRSPTTAGPDDVVARLTGADLAYDRDHVAVRSVELEVHAGTVVALVGGEGAGRTTVLRALAGRLEPVAGSVRRPHDDDVGVMPEQGATWPDLTVDENLDFARRARGAGRGPMVELRGRLGLDDAHDRLAGRLSGGMRQKLGLGMALLHRPRLLVLDEPTTGVDPLSRAEIWRLLGQQVASGTAIVMATGYMDEAARATHVLVMDDGTVLRSGSPTEVVRRMPGVVVRDDRHRGSRSWRRGGQLRTWVPTAVDEAGRERIEPDLEDAAIVAAMEQEESTWAR